jgi:hypothetical protein
MSSGSSVDKLWPSNLSWFHALNPVTRSSISCRNGPFRRPFVSVLVHGYGNLLPQGLRLSIPLTGIQLIKLSGDLHPFRREDQGIIGLDQRSALATGSDSRCLSMPGTSERTKARFSFFFSRKQRQ